MSEEANKPAEGETKQPEAPKQPEAEQKIARRRPEPELMTKADLEELKYLQSVDPDGIPMMQGNKDERYEFPVVEKNFVHVSQVPAKGNFDPDTGEQVKKAMVQKYSPREFMKEKRIGLKVVILHEPEELTRLMAAQSSKKESR